MEVDKKFLQVRGKLEIDKKYKLGDDINTIVTVTDIQNKDNQDGTIDQIYKARLLEEL